MMLVLVHKLGRNNSSFAFQVQPAVAERIMLLKPGKYMRRANFGVLHGNVGSTPWSSEPLS